MISFFGASVTQQRNGYAVKLKSKFVNEEVSIFYYGGMHLNNAGIAFIDDVLEKKPGYCFIDWFSTDYIDINKTTLEYIDTIIYKFTEAKCKLIFLFFVSKQYEKKKSFYSFCKNYLFDKGLCCIDLNDDLEYSTEILRDDIHTTDTGAEKYADIIYQKFNSQQINYPVKPILKTKYCDIKKLEVNGVYSKELKLTGKAHIIGFFIMVGRYSGIVEIKEDNKEKLEVNTWDRWCHYEREHFEIEFDLNDNARILISNKPFDTSSCKIKDCDFDKYKKKLVIYSIYYIGDTVRLKENLYSKSISKLKYILRKDTLKRLLGYSRN